MKKLVIGGIAMFVALVLQAQGVTGLVNLQWDYSGVLSTNLSFKLYGSTNNGATWTLVKTIPGIGLTTSFQLPTGPSTYALSISSSNSAGESAKSNILIADSFLPTTIPNSPTNLKIISSQ